MNPTDSIMMIMQNGVYAWKFATNYGLLLNTANHSIIVQGCAPSSGCIYASIISVGANTDTIKTSDDDTVNDAGTLWISFFDYQLY